jgi:hypothetical protein
MPTTQCSDGEDNDGDGSIDLEDPGCEDATDDDESDEEVNCYGREIIDLNQALEAQDPYVADLSTQGESRLQGTCGGDAGPEMLFKWSIDRPARRVVFSTQLDDTQVPVVMYLKNSCDEVEDIDCNRGASASPGTEVVLEDVEPGEYYLWVDTSSRMIGPGQFAVTVNIEDAPQCGDTLDNDTDGLIDLADPGCTDLGDEAEDDPDILPECADGIDNDFDQLVDYPNDPECTAAGVASEGSICRTDFATTYEVGQEGASLRVNFNPDQVESLTDGCRANSGAEAMIHITLDEASDIRVSFDSVDRTLPFSVYLRSDCDDAVSQLVCNNDLTTPLEATELPAGNYFLMLDAHDAGEVPASVSLQIDVLSLITECNDGVDNDDDMLIDLDDIGCSYGRDQSETDPNEIPVCSDGLDNDNDGLIDYPEDPECTGAGADYEAPLCDLITADQIVGMQGGTVSLDTTGADDNYEGSCALNANGSGERMVLLNLIGPASVNIQISNASSGFDSILYLRSECDNTATETCDDTGTASEELNFNRLEAGRYFVFLDGWSTGDEGTADLLFTVVPLIQPACSDEEDNDGDDLIDLEDLGCSTSYDLSEIDDGDVAACADGVDNDGDNLVDYPEDPDCFSIGWVQEENICV